MASQDIAGAGQGRPQYSGYGMNLYPDTPPKKPGATAVGGNPGGTGTVFGTPPSQTKPPAVSTTTAKPEGTTVGTMPAKPEPPKDTFYDDMFKGIMGADLGGSEIGRGYVGKGGEALGAGLERLSGLTFGADNVSAGKVSVNPYNNTKLAGMADEDRLQAIRGRYDPLADVMQGMAQGNDATFNQARDLIMSDMNDQLMNRMDSLSASQARGGISGSSMAAEQRSQQSADLMREMQRAQLEAEQADIANRLAASQAGFAGAGMMGGLEQQQFGTQVGAQSDYGQQRLAGDKMKLDAATANQEAQLKADLANQMADLQAQGMTLEQAQAMVSGAGEYSNLANASANMDRSEMERYNTAINLRGATHVNPNTQATLDAQKLANDQNILASLAAQGKTPYEVSQIAKSLGIDTSGMNIEAPKAPPQDMLQTMGGSDEWSEASPQAKEAFAAAFPTYEEAVAFMDANYGVREAALPEIYAWYSSRGRA